MRSLREMSENLRSTLEADPMTAPAAVDACEGEDPAGLERTKGLETDPPRGAKMESLTSLLHRGAQHVRRSR